MKKLVLLVTAMVFGMGTHAATTSETTVINYRYGNSFIFTERGITFAVYPDGEFDFYIDNRVNVRAGARIGNVGVTFNSGWDYNPFVQYDDYGAVIQVENIPIYYDYYGRVSQIGNVDVWYRNGRVRRVGGLHVYWSGGLFSHTTGYINVYNRYYVYRPFHRWFARPAVGFCNVWTSPYRRYYNPVRYTWYRPYRDNYRRTYAHVGKKYRYNPNRRSKVYRNDKRVAVRNQRSQTRRDYGRSSNDYASRRSTTRSNDTKVYRNNGKSNRTVERRGDYNRGNSTVRNNRDSNTVRNNRGNSVTQRTVTRTPRSTTVTKREVTRTPTKRTVTKKSTTYRKPTNNRAVVSNRSRGNTSTVKRSTSTQRRTVSKSTSSRSNNSSKARTRSSRRL